MEYVRPGKPDIFVSYASVDDVMSPDGSPGWVTDFVKWLQFRLDQLLGVRDACRLWMDVQLPKNARLDASLEQQVRDCAVMIVILSEGYLKSEWCGKELADFLEEEIARRSSSGSPIFVVELSNLNVPAGTCQTGAGRPAVLGDGYYLAPGAPDRYREERAR